MTARHTSRQGKACHVMWCSNSTWRQAHYGMQQRQDCVCVRRCVQCCVAEALSVQHVGTNQQHPEIILADTTAGNSTTMLTGLGEGLGGLGEGLGDFIAVTDCGVHTADMTSCGRQIFDTHMLCVHHPARACNNHGIQNIPQNCLVTRANRLQTPKWSQWRCYLVFSVFGQPCHTKPYNATGNSTARSPDWGAWGLGAQPAELYKHRSRNHQTGDNRSTGCSIMALVARMLQGCPPNCVPVLLLLLLGGVGITLYAH